MICSTRFLLPLLAPLSLGFYCTPAAETALIRLKSAATVSTPVIRLADVAEIQDADPQQITRLGAMTLAPAAARPLQLDFESIRTRLTAQGVNLAELEFSGSSVVTVSAAAALRTAAQLEAAASAKAIRAPAPAPVPEGTLRRIDKLVAATVSDYLQERAPQLGAIGVSVKLKPDQALLLAACGYVKYEVTGGSEPWTDAQVFDLNLVDRDGKPHEIQVSCQVTPHTRVLVLKHNVPPGHLLQPDDVTWQQIPPLKNRGQMVNRLESLTGRETMRVLRAGEPIMAQDIRAVPLVRRGDIITVVSRKSGITVRMEAKAQGDGSAGQPIMLISLDGKHKLSARVTGYHQAEVTRDSGDRAPDPSEPVGVRFVSAERERNPDKPGSRNLSGVLEQTSKPDQ